MTEQGLERANRIKEEISVLESEIKCMKPKGNTFKVRSFRFIKRNKKPDVTTVNNYWESDRTLDSVSSVIVLTPDEVDMVREYKESKIEKLQKEFESLA